MLVRILVGMIMLLMSIPSDADELRYSCGMMTRDNWGLKYIQDRKLELAASNQLNFLLRRLALQHPINKIDLPAQTNMTDLERGYLRATNVYIRDLNHGAISAALFSAIQLLLGQLEAEEFQFEEYWLKLIAKFKNRKFFDPSVEQAFESLAEKRHKPSLRCLGHIYRYGIGVEVDLATAWGFYDTYNLVAGIDGKDEFRDAVSEEMTDLQILEGQGLARTFRGLYTDAWKVPSMSIIQ
jgi:hypothetical protein